MAAIITAVRQGDIEFLKAYLRGGSNVNIKDDNGWTPLHEASYYGFTKCVEFLLDHNADVNIKDNFGWTPLHYASHNGHTECIELLLDHNADPNSKTHFGLIPLYVASNGGYIECVELLLEHGADRNILNRNGHTALDVCPKDNVTLLKLLMGGGAATKAAKR